MAMAYHQSSQPVTYPQEEETILQLRVFGVVVDYGVFIMKGRYGFLEGNPVLQEVPAGLARIPYETKRCHTYIVCMECSLVNRFGRIEE